MPRAAGIEFRVSSSRFHSLPLTAAAMLDGVVLAFDFGARRTGVAIANSVTRAARPLTTITADTNDVRWNAITALFEQWHPSQWVVGIPRHPDGAANEMTARCERFARQLEGRFGRTVARVDERYTSAVTGGDDAEAAVLILQQWIDQDAQAEDEGDHA